MVRSMTGFGAAAGAVEGVQYSVEARSVNNRYFRANLKLPDSFTAAETELENLLREKLSRGTVSLTVSMRLPEDKAAYRINTAALSSYIEQLRPVEVDANPMLRIDLASLLELPGVCEPPPLDEICRKTKKGMTALVEQAVGALVKMREKEGKSLAADMLNRCDEIESNMAVVAKRSPLVVREYQQRLTERVTELTNAGRVKIDADVLAREIAIFAERCDIAEEVSRLTAHVAQFRAAMKISESAGRKLEFLAQEMLREGNTMASKSNDIEIARAVVEIKTAIDRIKEQVQNVE